jgi:hypothetical protein
MYENGTMRSVEIVLRKGEGDKGDRWRVNLTKIYGKHFHKCNNAPLIQL